MKTVIEMAREAGLRVGPAGMGQTVWGSDEELERFAELVRADERNRTWTQEHWTEYERSIVEAEREACAKVCDGLADMHAKMDQWGSHKTAETLAQAIRARSNT